MNLYRINLNLLKVFSVLMREQHVSDAAKHLHLTQSAISNSLQQLREIFQDELLVRGPKKMLPTKKALILAPKIDQALCQLEESMFHTDEFTYKTSDRIFNLAMTDSAEYIILPKLYEQLKNLAPNISLKILTYNDFSPESFENDKIELYIGLEKKVPKQFITERLFSDHSVCVAHADHPIFKKSLTLTRYLQAEHLAACVYSEELHRADQALKKLKLTRNIRLTMSNALPALQILANSNLLGTFSKSFVKQTEKTYHLKYQPVPFDIPEFHIAQVWHRQQDNDSGLAWLRDLIKKTCKIHF